MDERRGRAIEIGARARAEVVLAAHPATVAWLTGFAGDIETGPSPFSLPALAVLVPGDPPVLVVSEDDAGAAEALGCGTATYTGFTTDPLDPVGGARTALLDAIAGRRAATELGSLPAALADGLSLTDVTKELALARAIKDPDELDAIRNAIRLCDAGQHAARAHAVPGVTELELWGRIREAIDIEAGSRTPLLADLVSGPRTEEIGGPPSERTIAAGEPVLCDLVPRSVGYWGDSCATFVVGGEANASLRDAHRRSRDALDRAIELIRPGAVAGDVDEAVRSDLGFPHHTGHGLGTEYHEEPRIVPGSPTVLEPGMVVALEPGIYDDGQGVRVERVVAVTRDGCDILSGHSLDL